MIKRTKSLAGQKTFLYLFFALLLLLSPASILSNTVPIKPSSKTLAKSLQSWKQKIEDLRTDLDRYKQRLIGSQLELEQLQIRLETLQKELEMLSRDLTISIESSASFSISLDELRLSLESEARQIRRDKIVIGVVSGAGGLVVGALAVILYHVFR